MKILISDGLSFDCSFLRNNREEDRTLKRLFLIAQIAAYTIPNFGLLAFQHDFGTLLRFTFSQSRPHLWGSGKSFTSLLTS